MKKNFAIVSLLILAFWGFVTESHAQKGKVSSKESTNSKINTKDSKDLAKLIEQAIVWLKAKEYEKCFRRFVPPKTIKQWEETGNFESNLNTFRNEKVDRLLKILKKIKGTQAEFSELNGEFRATFYFEPTQDMTGVAKSGKMIFVKIDKLWYVLN